MMLLGEAIKEFREEHGLSLRAFAKMTGMSAAYISNIERGETSRGNAPTPSIASYVAIANAMHITIEELLSMVQDDVVVNRPSVSSPVYSEEERNLIGCWRIMSEADKKVVAALMERYGFTYQPIEQDISFKVG